MAWIHTPVGNPMSEVARLAGIGVTPADPTDLTKPSGWEPEAGWVSSAELALPLIAAQALYCALPSLRATLGPGASVADAIAPFLASIPLAPDSADHRRAAFALGRRSVHAERVHRRRARCDAGRLRDARRAAATALALLARRRLTSG